jgi:hypothetical protein
MGWGLPWSRLQDRLCAKSLSSPSKLRRVLDRCGRSSGWAVGCGGNLGCNSSMYWHLELHCRICVIGVTAAFIYPKFANWLVLVMETHCFLLGRKSVSIMKYLYQLILSFHRVSLLHMLLFADWHTLNTDNIICVYKSNCTLVHAPTCFGSYDPSSGSISYT